jgi:putative phosphoesterase
MKIAVLADIHANYRALETVIAHVEDWKPDTVLVAGDIVNRGPRSLCCLEWIEEKRKIEGWQVIRGNHEDYVISRDEPDAPQSGPLYEMFQPVRFTYDQLHGDVSKIRSLPEQISLDFGEAGEVRMLHASMLSNRDGIYPETTNTELEELIAPAPTVFITGHTHRALVRRLNGTLVVNAGSVGLPFDCDTRAGYAQIVWENKEWQAEIIRLEYDMAAAERDYFDYGFMQEGGPLAELVLMEMKFAMSQLYPWTQKYNLPVQKGEITVEEATKEFLENPINRPYWGRNTTLGRSSA